MKVRNHHGLLTITSLNKLYFSEDIEISFSGENPQTYCLLKTKSAIENNFNALKKLISVIGFPPLEDRKILKGKTRHLLYKNVNIEALCEFVDNFQIEQPSIRNSTLSDYVKAQAKKNTISEWSICVVGNTDEEVFIDYVGNTSSKERRPNSWSKTYELTYKGETITMGCSVRNQQNLRGGDSYLISKNQIDQTADRQVDLSVQHTDYKEIKKRRAFEKKGLLLIYALDERGTFFEEKYGLPIIGFSIHFPKIEDEEKVSYKVTKTYSDLDTELMLDDDNPETEENQ